MDFLLRHTSIKAKCCGWTLIATTLLAATAQSQNTPSGAKAAAKPAPQKHIDAIKKSWASSQARLRQYEWIETTVTSHKGKEKSRVVKRCYYGAEGALQKVMVSTSPKPKKTRGLRGKIKKNKVDKMAEYMKNAAALVQKYLPPNSAKIQACKAAGKALIHVLDPGKRAKIQLNDYLQAGDHLAFDFDLAKSRLLQMSVVSHLDKDPVTLAITLASFPDGTIYTSRTTLVAKAQEVTVVVEQSGFKKLAK